MFDAQKLRETIDRGDPWVILVEHKTHGRTVVKDPGMNMPWHSTNERQAKVFAGEVQQDPDVLKAEAVRARFALNYLLGITTPND